MSDQTITWYENEGGIYSRTRDGKETFYVRVWRPAVKAMGYSKAGSTILQARRKLAQIQADPEKFFQKRDAPPAPKALSFGELVKQFLAGYRSRGDSGYYDMVSVPWLEHFSAKTPADKVTRVMVEDYRESLRRQEYGDSTIRKYVGALGTCYRWAIGRGLLMSNPAQDVKRPSEPDRQVEVL